MQVSQTQRSKFFQRLRRKAKGQQADLALLAHLENSGARGTTATHLLETRKAIVLYCIEQENGGRCSRDELVRSDCFASIRTGHRRLDALLEVPGHHYREEAGDFIIENFLGGYRNPIVRAQLEARKLRKARNDRYRARKKCQENPVEQAEIREYLQSWASETEPLEAVSLGAKSKHSPSDPPPAPKPVGRERPAARDVTALSWEEAMELPASEKMAWLAAQPYDRPEVARSSQLGGKNAFRPELIAHLRPTEAERAKAEEAVSRCRTRVRNWGGMVANHIKMQRAGLWN